MLFEVFTATITATRQGWYFPFLGVHATAPLHQVSSWRNSLLQVFTAPYGRSNDSKHRKQKTHQAVVLDCIQNQSSQGMPHPDNLKQRYLTLIIFCWVKATVLDWSNRTPDASALALRLSDGHSVPPTPCQACPLRVTASASELPAGPGRQRQEVNEHSHRMFCQFLSVRSCPLTSRLRRACSYARWRTQAGSFLQCHGPRASWYPDTGKQRYPTGIIFRIQATVLGWSNRFQMPMHCHSVPQAA